MNNLIHEEITTIITTYTNIHIGNYPSSCSPSALLFSPLDLFLVPLQMRGLFEAASPPQLYNFSLMLIGE